MEPYLTTSHKQLDELIRVNRLKRYLAIYGLKHVNERGEIVIWGDKHKSDFWFLADVKELLVKKKGKWQYKDKETKADVMAIRWLDNNG